MGCIYSGWHQTYNYNESKTVLCVFSRTIFSVVFLCNVQWLSTVNHTVSLATVVVTAAPHHKIEPYKSQQLLSSPTYLLQTAIATIELVGIQMKIYGFLLECSFQAINYFCLWPFHFKTKPLNIMCRKCEEGSITKTRNVFCVPVFFLAQKNRFSQQ